MEQEVSELLRELAIELGTTTEYLWGVLIRQAGVNVTKSIIWICLSSIIVFICINFIRRCVKDFSEKEGWFYNNDEGGISLAIIGGLVALLFICAICVDTARIIDCSMNPEYWALNEILEKI